MVSMIVKIIIIILHLSRLSSTFTLIFFYVDVLQVHVKLYYLEAESGISKV